MGLLLTLLAIFASISAVVALFTFKNPFMVIPAFIGGAVTGCTFIINIVVAIVGLAVAAVIALLIIIGGVFVGHRTNDRPVERLESGSLDEAQALIAENTPPIDSYNKAVEKIELSYRQAVEKINDHYDDLELQLMLDIDDDVVIDEKQHQVNIARERHLAMAQDKFEELKAACN